MEKYGKGPNGSAFSRAADEEEEWQMCRKIGSCVGNKVLPRKRQSVDEVSGTLGEALVEAGRWKGNS